MTISEATRTALRIVPQTPTLGAVIEGVDAHEPPGEELVAALKEALLTYKVLFFRGQHLSQSEHHAFATAFGAPFANPGRFNTGYDEEGLTDVRVVPHFHADLMYMEEGPSFSMLQMLELPEVGGDTMWADLTESYRSLSEPLRAFLETLTVVQAHPSYYFSDEELARSHRAAYGEELSAEQLRELRAHLAPREAPLVRVIPETGEKNYWISAQHTRAIRGLSTGEGDALLSLLFAHQLEPRYVYRWRWSVGDIAFWDHRTTLHCGIADFGSERRFAQRVSVAANRPIPARP